MLGWFHALMPKEDRFFDLFARHSEAGLAGATALRARLEGGDAVRSNYETVRAREHDADDVPREVLLAVRR
ncbi:MAG: nuclease PIN, partial [Pseudolabrys sp.]